MKKIKKRFKKVDRETLVFWSVVAVLTFVLVFICFQNISLKNEIKEVRAQEYIKVGEGINDFNAMIIEKVNTCLPVQIASGEENVVVLGTQCLEMK